MNLFLGIIIFLLGFILGVVIRNIVKKIVDTDYMIKKAREIVAEEEKRKQFKQKYDFLEDTEDKNN